MKLVRSHEIFRLLRDLSVLRRQKLRRYRRVQHIRQYRAKLLIPAGIRVVAHQVAHQRLRNGGIDRIHGHVIAVVRRPAECKLREIAGSDDHAALFVGNVHQNLRPLSCLAVLIGHIMNGRILPDITEMHIHRFLDVDFRKIRAEAPDQGHRVVIGPVRRPKPGIVTALIRSCGMPSRSNARTVTSSASVESRPPEMPTTAVLQCVCSRRF